MNKWLKGNGYWCPTCKGTGTGKITDVLEYEGGTFAAFRALCETCKGDRRIAAELADVIALRVPQSTSPEPTCFLPIIEYGNR